MVSESFVEQLASFEVMSPQELQPGRPIVARLLGRKFDQLFAGRFEKPFDPLLGKMVVKTLSHLCANLGASYGYAERTEMSLFAIASGGEARRLVSRIGGEASAKMSLLLGEIATFEARLYELPDSGAVQSYFAWRRAEAEALALDAYCRHVLVSVGAERDAVPRILEGLGSDEKVELLRQNSFDWGKVPAWQRHGVGVYVAQGGDGAPQLVVDLQLPPDEGYGEYLQRFVA